MRKASKISAIAAIGVSVAIVALGAATAPLMAGAATSPSATSL